MLSFGWLFGALVAGLVLVLAYKVGHLTPRGKIKAQIRRETGNSQAPARQRRASTLVAGGCWLMALGMGVAGFNGQSAISDDQGTQSAFVESEGTRQARANMLDFRRRAPHIDVIQQVCPWGKRNPLGVTVFVSSQWDHESDATKKHLLNTWAALWFASAKPGSARHVRPEFWLGRGRARRPRIIERLKPEDLRPG